MGYMIILHTVERNCLLARLSQESYSHDLDLWKANGGLLLTEPVYMLTLSCTIKLSGGMQYFIYHIYDK